ncbi:TonB-dependent receptor family protein [bacterium]|nr:TonB-dependent receptor family protein [bacterium]
MRLSFTLFVALLFLSATVFAESDGEEKKGVRVYGAVVDASTKKPLIYANVVLFKASGEEVAASSYSGETGEFLLTGVEPGRYTLVVTYVGYEEKRVADFEVKGGSEQVNAGTLALAPSAVEVDEVTVEADRPTEEFHLDKKVINVGKSLQNRGGSALDVLRDQPSVRVDANDNVTLRGSSNFTVLVNGRPYPFQGSDALRQLPANLIESIELITNPSAKYEAEGSTGIINVVLRRENDYSSSAIVNIGAGTRDKYNTDATVSMNYGATKVTGGLDYRRNAYHQVQDVDRLTMTPQGNIVNETDLRRRDIRDQYNVRLGIEHTMDETHTLSLNASGGQVKIPRSFAFDVHNTSPSLDLYQQISNNFDLTATYINGTAFYEYQIEPENSKLTAEAVYTRVLLPYTQVTREYDSDPTFRSRSAQPYSTQLDSDANRHEARAKMNYMKKFSPTSTFETGWQSDYSIRSYDVVSSVYDWGQDTWLGDEQLSNVFDLTNYVHAGFMTWADVLLGLQYQVGLRAEYMDRLLTQKTLGEDYAYDKLDWFPSFSMARKFGTHTLQFSYSRRINRPNENLLNPFPFYNDTYLSTAGNPRLLPEYTHAMELNYQKMFGGVYMSVQTYARLSTNTVWQAQSATDDGKMNITFGNFAETSNMGAELTASYRPATWLRLDPNLNLFNNAVKGTAFGRDIDEQAFTWTGRLSAIFTITPMTRLQITGMYLSEQIGPQSTTDPLFYLSVTARQDFFDRVLSVTLQARNLLETSYYNVSSIGQNFANSFVVKPEVPVVNLTLTYNFNNYRPTRRQDGDVDVNVGI